MTNGTTDPQGDRRGWDYRGWRRVTGAVFRTLARRVVFPIAGRMSLWFGDNPFPAEPVRWSHRVSRGLGRLGRRWMVSRRTRKVGRMILDGRIDTPKGRRLIHGRKHSDTAEGG